MEQFEDLESWELLVESRQYRVPSMVKRLDLRNVADFAFLDLISLFILSNEYQSAPIAARYADKTISYRNFSKARLAGTDLYVSMNILSDPSSIFSQRIAQNPEADAILRSKIKLNLPTMKRYLDLLADGKMSGADASSLLLRIEKQLNITDSKLKSIRRLAQDWQGLTSMQRELVVTRMLQYYKKFARRSEMLEFLEDLGKSKGYEMRGPIDAELANLGLGEPSASKQLASALVPIGGLYLGYQLGKRLFSPKDDK